MCESPTYATTPPHAQHTRRLTHTEAKPVARVCDPWMIPITFAWLRLLVEKCSLFPGPWLCLPPPPLLLTPVPKKWKA